MDEANGAATGISGLIHEWRADYTWYLRDGVPGILFLLMIGIINLHVELEDIKWPAEPHLVAGGILAALVAPGIGFVLGGAAGMIWSIISWATKRLHSLPWSGRRSSADVNYAMAWLNKNARAAWEEEERLRSMGILTQTLCLLCGIAIADWLSLANKPFDARLGWLVASAVALFVVSVNGKVYHANATVNLCKARREAEKTADYTFGQCSASSLASGPDLVTRLEFAIVVTGVVIIPIGIVFIVWGSSRGPRAGDTALGIITATLGIVLVVLPRGIEALSRRRRRRANRFTSGPAIQRSAPALIQDGAEVFHDWPIA